MTTPLLALTLFAAWTIFVLLHIAYHRWKCVFTGTVPREGFPSDVAPEDGWYRRVLQAHKNCVENLAIFAAIVLVLSLMGLESPVINNLSIAIIAGRVAQSLVHILLVQTRPVVMIRFTFFLVQVVSFIWLITLILLAQ